MLDGTPRILTIRFLKEVHCISEIRVIVKIKMSWPPSKMKNYPEYGA